MPWRKVVAQGPLVVPLRDQVDHSRRTYGQDRHPRDERRLGPHIRSEDGQLGMAAVREAGPAVPQPDGPVRGQLHYRVHHPGAEPAAGWVLAWYGIAAEGSGRAYYGRAGQERR